LLHDSTFCAESAEGRPLFGHSTAKEAGIVARRAGVKRLVLAHFGDASASARECVAEASREFSGKTVAASDLEEFVCGEPDSRQGDHEAQ